MGAGISGLSAGFHLAKAGFKPVIFEKAPVPGGRMSSDTVEGFVIDKAAYTLPEFYRNLLRFLGQVGMENALVETPSTSSTFAGGKEYPLKMSSPKDFLGYKLLSLKNKKDMAKLLLYARSLGKALNVGRPNSKTFELENESASDYLLKNYDEEILEKIAYPIFCEIYLGRPERNSRLAFLSTLRTLTWSRIYALEKGMGSLPARLAGELEVRVNSPVLKVTALAGNGPYQVHVGGRREETLTVEAVIMAIPLPLVPKIVEKLPDELKTYFRNVVYSPSIVMAMAVDQRFENRSMINNFLRTDSPILGTLTFDRHKGPGRVPREKDLATAILTEPMSRALLDEPEDRIRDLVLKEMDALYPGFSSKFLFSRIYRWEQGALQLPPGQLLKRDPVREFLEQGIHGLYFAGESFPVSSLEASFNTGIRAANHIIRKMDVNSRP